MTLTPVVYHFYNLWDKSAIPVWINDSFASYRMYSHDELQGIMRNLNENIGIPHKFICLNDGTSDPNDGWEKKVEAILEKLFPEPSIYEKN